MFVAVWVIIRSIAGQVSAVKDNTRAIDALTKKMDTVVPTIDKHGEDIAYLKGRLRR